MAKIIKMKDLIKESTWKTRKFGDPLPTMEDYKAAYEKKQLNEKRELPTDGITKIHTLTQRNNHTEARRLLSSWMGNDKLMSFYEAMETLNKVFNGFPPELSKLNQKMEKALYKDLKKSYANADIIIDAL